MRNMSRLLHTCLEAPRGVKKFAKDTNPLGPSRGSIHSILGHFFKFCNNSIPRLVLNFFAKNQFDHVQNMSSKASNPKMIVQNVAWNRKIHFFSKFGVISFTIVDFSISHLVFLLCFPQKARITIMDKKAPNWK